MSRQVMRVEGDKELIRELGALGGRQLRSVVMKSARAVMKPVLQQARAEAPVDSGRLRASIGHLVESSRNRTAVMSRVGTRRDFTYKSTGGQKLVSGRGKKRDKALAKGFIQDRKTAQQYASVVHFGSDKSGRVRRKAGPAMFLENPMRRNMPRIINNLSAELRRHMQSAK